MRNDNDGTVCIIGQRNDYTSLIASSMALCFYDKISVEAIQRHYRHKKAKPWSGIQLSKKERKNKTPQEIVELRIKKWKTRSEK